MRETVQAAWDILKEAYEVAKPNTPGLVFHSSKFDDCYHHFKKWRTLLLDRFMKPDVKALDRHKIAAILTISIIESKAISYEGSMEGKIFLGTQLLAVSCGLSYMQTNLNKLLTLKNEKTIDKYIMPVPFSCETNYFDIIARNLYYEENGTDTSGEQLWRLNPLQLANTYYLIELYTLEHHHINTSILRE